LNALASESIGRRCWTLPNASSGAAPTRCVGESGETSSGNFVSSASSSFISASYSASLTVGASWT
jgi:hypothetical protein